MRTAIEGKNKAPHSTRVAETGSDRGGVSTPWLRKGVLITSKEGSRYFRTGVRGMFLTKKLSKASSQRTNRPNINITGTVGKPIKRNIGSACSIKFNPSVVPTPCIIVKAPKVTAVQYTDPMTKPAATNGHTRYITRSAKSRMRISLPENRKITE